jgi:ethanolamine ammonia-lyase small subunit
MTPPTKRPGAVTPAGWADLRRHTDARIALGRAGHSLPTAPHLAFQLAHAQARDAVHLPFDAARVIAGLQAAGLETLALHSAASDRTTYLQRPDLGRRLDESSQELLRQWQAAHSPVVDGARFDLAFVIADGLSALAVHAHAIPLLAATLALLEADRAQTWHIAPIAVVGQARVAVGDEVGAALQARCVVVLIGERPGLSSPDSLGVYLTWHPRAGLVDADRNCISNVRAAGLPVEAAAVKLGQLLSAARVGAVTGIALKDEFDAQAAQALPSLD